VLRELDPGRVPASCEQCGKVELMEENEEVWSLFLRFPSIVRSDGFGGISLDHRAATYVAERETDCDIIECLEKFESIVKGLRSRHGDRKHA